MPRSTALSEIKMMIILLKNSFQPHSAACAVIYRKPASKGPVPIRQTHPFTPPAPLSTTSQVGGASRDLAFFFILNFLRQTQHRSVALLLQLLALSLSRLLAFTTNCTFTLVGANGPGPGPGPAHLLRLRASSSSEGKIIQPGWSRSLHAAPRDRVPINGERVRAEEQTERASIRLCPVEPASDHQHAVLGVRFALFASFLGATVKHGAPAGMTDLVVAVIEQVFRLLHHSFCMRSGCCWSDGSPLRSLQHAFDAGVVY